MRYKKLLFALLIILLPVVVLAKDVSIKSVNLAYKSNYVEELSEPIYKNLTVNFDIRFQSVGDIAVYEVTISNKEEDNYFLNLNVNSDSKYIKYTLESDENTNIIKGNKDTKIYIVIEYKNEVPEDLFIYDKYNENNSIKLLLTNNKGEEVIVDGDVKKSIIDGSSKKSVVVNPSTGNIILKIKNTNIVISLYTLLIVLIISIIAIIILRKIKVKKFINLLLIMSLLIPGLAMALKEVTIVINSKIEIEQVDLISFSILREDPNNNGNIMTDTVGKKLFIYKAPKEMRWREWKNSKYNVDNLDIYLYYRFAEETTCIDGRNYVERVRVAVDNAHEYYPGSPPPSNNNTQEEKIYSDDEIENDGLYEVKKEDCKISFTIDSNRYRADPGMTWREWLESDYNVDNIHFEGTKAPVASIPCSGFVYYLSRVRDSTENIESYDDIIERRDYYLIESVHLCTG